MLTIRGLETGYGKVLRGVDLTVPDGGIVALFGGTGKPTLLKCVSGLLPVRSGHGLPCSDLPAPARRHPDNPRFEGEFQMTTGRDGDPTPQ